MEKLEKLPAGLEALYEQILTQLSTYNGEEHPDRHLQVFHLVTIALRPLYLREVVALGDLLPRQRI